MRDFWNKLGNIFVKPVLHSPLHFLLSGQVLLISVMGRKTGKTYTTPVQYRREGDSLTIITQRQRKWWRNLQGGASATLWLKGQPVIGDASVVIDEAEDIRRTLRWMYPRMSETQIGLLAPHSVLVRIQLRETQVVRASV